MKLAKTFDLIINTVSAKIDWNGLLGLLKIDGAMVQVGVPEEPVPLAAFALLAGRRSLAGSAIGSIPETQEMLDFCGQHGISADIEVIPIEGINKAFERVVKSDVRFRFVIDARLSLAMRAANQAMRSVTYSAFATDRFGRDAPALAPPSRSNQKLVSTAGCMPLAMCSSRWYSVTSQQAVRMYSIRGQRKQKALTCEECIFIPENVAVAEIYRRFGDDHGQERLHRAKGRGRLRLVQRKAAAAAADEHAMRSPARAAGESTVGGSC